jgi:hypothetical protein
MQHVAAKSLTSKHWKRFSWHKPLPTALDPGLGLGLGK